MDQIIAKKNTGLYVIHWISAVFFIMLGILFIVLRVLFKDNLLLIPVFIVALPIIWSLSYCVPGVTQCNVLITYNDDKFTFYGQKKSITKVLPSDIERIEILSRTKRSSSVVMAFVKVNVRGVMKVWTQQGDFKYIRVVNVHGVTEKIDEIVKANLTLRQKDFQYYGILTQE